MISASIDLDVNTGLCRNTDPSSQVWVNGVGEALLGQSQEGAETPPRSSSSGLLDDLHSKGMSGKPPPLLHISSCEERGGEGSSRFRLKGRSLSHSQGDMTALRAVGDSPPMAELSCFRGFWLCYACRPEK
ncbi:hypothetical protein Taro_020551 [Colocasia esculenta]|uniref:Uncharacterized protein n=1 Tax=Colocasia esculenta TaxID=4460 RepID=A0A843UZW7_COLES|nr:hypothetical protein [Colocasia esculenta]